MHPLMIKKILEFVPPFLQCTRWKSRWPYLQQTGNLRQIPVTLILINPGAFPGKKRKLR